MSSINKQIHLEALRGIAALIVVASHYATAFYPSSIFGSQYQAHQAWERLFTTTPLGIVFAAHFAVCLFFILSGYVLSLPYLGESSRDSNDLLAALLKRPFRLGGLVLVTILMSLCLAKFGFFFNVPVSEASHSTPWFRDFWSHDPPRFKRLMLDLTTRMFATGSQYNPPLWTLQLELYGSFLVYIFLLLFRQSRWRYFSYAYALLFFHGSLYHGFVFGVILADLSKNAPAAINACSRGVIAWTLLMFGLVVASYPIHLDPFDLAQTFYGAFPQLPLLGGGYAMLGALMVFVSVLLNRRLQRLMSGPVFAFLGRISYAMYVSHFLLLGSLSSYLFLTLNSRWNYNTSCAMVWVFSIAVLVAISYCLTIYVDEPVTRIASRLAKMQRLHARENDQSVAEKRSA